MAKLPFRIVELVNESWKYGKCLPYRVELNTGVRDGKLESQQRKKQKRIFRSKLITQAKPHEDALHIFEQINLLHGTNSALLPMIDETLELIPSGRLLDQGRAPMGGEIDKGGMRGANTVNQHTLSADTIRNISLCWDYAFRISNSFDPEKYSNPKELFLETLKELTETSPEYSDWDPLIVTLLRLKQWNPDAFEKLCEEHKKEIELCKETVKDRWLSKNEQMVQKAINFDMDRLMAAKKEKSIPEYLKTEFALNYTPKTWDDELDYKDPLLEFLKNPFYKTLNGNGEYPGWKCLLLKLFAKEELQKFRSEIDHQSDESEKKLLQLYYQRLKKNFNELFLNLF